MRILLYGEDTFRSRRHLHKMVEEFKRKRDPDGFNVSFLDAEKEEPSRVLEMILTPPFLADRRMIVVECLLAEGKKELQETLYARMQEGTIPKENVLLFWEGENEFKKNALFEFLIQEPYAQKFELPKGKELSQWVVREIEARGGKIMADALAVLLADGGGDMWKLAHRISQLIAYSETGVPMPRAVVEQFVEEKIDDNIFHLLDALSAQNAKAAYTMLGDQLRAGVEVQQIFAMIVRQVRILAELKDHTNRFPEDRPEMIAKTLGVHPFVIQKSLSLIQKFSIENLRQQYQRLLLLDTQTKIGFADPKILLDILVAKMVAA